MGSDLVTLLGELLSKVVESTESASQKCKKSEDIIASATLELFQKPVSKPISSDKYPSDNILNVPPKKLDNALRAEEDALAATLKQRFLSHLSGEVILKIRINLPVFHKYGESA